MEVTCPVLKRHEVVAIASLRPVVVDLLLGEMDFQRLCNYELAGSEVGEGSEACNTQGQQKDG